MSDQEILDYDDLGAALREGRSLHPARSYRIEFGLEGLDFRAVHVPEAVPTGGQILHAASLEATDDISLLAILSNGEFEEVLLDQPFDLHGRGTKHLVAFRTDRLFKLTLNGHLVQWGNPEIRGSVLYQLGNAGDHEAVFIEAPSGNSLIERDAVIDLAAPGIEHFITAPRTFEIIVNSRPRIVTGRKVTFEEVVQMAFPGAHASNVIFSTTYRHVASIPHHGELAAGGFVEVKNGSVFNVTRTVQS